MSAPVSKPTTVSELYSWQVTQSIISTVRDATAVNNIKSLSVSDVFHLFQQGLSIKEVWGFLNNDGSNGVLNSSIVPSNLNSPAQPFATVKTFMSAIPVGSNTIIDEIFDLKIPSLSTYKNIMTYWAVGGVNPSTGVAPTGWVAITDTSSNTIFDFSVVNCYNTKQILSNLFIATVDNGNSFAWLKSALSGITRPSGVSLYAAFTSMIPISQRTGPVYANANFVLSDLIEITGQNVRDSTGSNFMDAWNLILPFANGSSGAKISMSSINLDQATTAFRRVRSHGFLLEDIYASDLWKSTTAGIVAQDSTQARILINAFNAAYDTFLDTATLEARLSWFGLFKAESSSTVNGVTTKVNANLSPLDKALVMLKDGDSVDAVFTYLTSVKSTVNNAWKVTTYTKKTSAAADFNNIRSLPSFANFSAETFTSAVNLIVYFSSAKTTISGTSMSTTPTNNLLQILASGFGNNSFAYTQTVGNSPIMYSYVTNVPVFAYAASNLAVALGSSGSFTTITLATSATVTSFFSYIFGSDVTTYLRANLTSVNSTDLTANNNALGNNFSISFNDATKVNEVVDTVLKTVPVAGSSIYGTTPVSNLLKYALTAGVIGSQIIDRVISLATTDTDYKVIHTELNATTLYDRMIAGTVSKVNVAKIYNYVAKYTTIAAAMTTTPATSTVILAADANGYIANLRTGAFLTYTATPTTPSLTSSTGVYNTNYELVSNTKLLKDFYAALDDITVNAVLRSTSTGTYGAHNAGSWLNYLDTDKVNIGKSITGFNSTTSTINYIGYPLTNIFSTGMLYPTYSFNFETGVQSSNVTYVQVVSGKKAVDLGYDKDDVQSIINAPPL